MKIRIRTMLFLGIVLISLLINMAPAPAEEILIIAHPGVQSDSLERAAVADIYKNRKTKWDNGDTIRVVMLKKGATHETFGRAIVKTTPAKLKKLWKKVIFTGAGTPPKILKTEPDLIEFIAETDSAIGYIDSSTPHEGVKVISLTEK